MPRASAARDLLPLSLCSTHMMYARSTASSVGLGGVCAEMSGSTRRSVTRSGSASSPISSPGVRMIARSRAFSIRERCRPRVFHQRGEHGFGQALHRLVSHSGDALESVRRAAEYRPGALGVPASTGDDVQSVVEIAAEVADPDLIVRSDSSPRRRACRRNPVRGADGNDFAMLQRASPPVAASFRRSRREGSFDAAPNNRACAHRAR